MNNELKIFTNKEFGQVRTVLKDGELMFCLSDICKILEIKNVSDCKTRLKKRWGSFNRGHRPTREKTKYYIYYRI